MRRSLVEVLTIVSTMEAMPLKQTDLTVLIVLESLGKGQNDSPVKFRGRIVRC